MHGYRELQEGLCSRGSPANALTTLGVRQLAVWGGGWADLCLGTQWDV